MCIERERVTSAVGMALHETLFALGPCIQYASATCSPQTRLHTLGLWNIFLATEAYSGPFSQTLEHRL